MNPADPTTGFPAPPGERALPDPPRRRRELLAVIAADRPGPRVPRWAVALGAAVAVTAIAVTAAALVPLVRAQPPARGHRPATATRPAAAACTAPGGAECQRTDRFTQPAPPGGLSVRDDVGSVTVTGGDGGSVSVTERVTYRGAPPELLRSARSGVLALGYRCRSSDCGVSYDIEVPRSLSVQVTTGIGSIWLNTLAGPVRARADVGGVHATGLTAHSAELGTDVGSIDAAFTAAPDALIAAAGTGQVTLLLPAGPAYAVTASADVGQVAVSVTRDSASDHVIRASTDVGSVTVTGG
ncbi:MAG TPA: hypothetical protein VMI33_12910 [Streptosporangiaceae bacterium]|nr:hypothetical protein [Streptosporangiaceae bacterium]